MRICSRWPSAVTVAQIFANVPYWKLLLITYFCFALCKITWPDAAMWCKSDWNLRNVNHCSDLQGSFRCSRLQHCFILYCFSHFVLRRRGKEPHAIHTDWHRGLSAHLLFRLLWCVCCSDSDDAILPAEHPESSARGLQLCRLGSCQIYSGCGFSLCSVDQVRKRKAK